MSLRTDPASRTTHSRRPVILDEATRESIVQLIRADLRRVRANETYARTFAMPAESEGLRAQRRRAGCWRGWVRT